MILNGTFNHEGNGKVIKIEWRGVVNVSLGYISEVDINPVPYRAFSKLTLENQHAIIKQAWMHAGNKWREIK